MKSFKIICLSVLIFSICSAFTFPFLKNSHTVYAFGMAASFKDTIVYFTEIQSLDSVKLKGKFLPERGNYSYELKTYFEDKLHQKGQTCIIFFSKDKEHLRKQEKKLRNRYKKDFSAVIKNITYKDFHFTKPVDTDHVQ